MRLFMLSVKVLLDGQHWDWELSGCVITNSADINLDGCVKLNDLDLLVTVIGSRISGSTGCFCT